LLAWGNTIIDRAFRHRRAMLEKHLDASIILAVRGHGSQRGPSTTSVAAARALADDRHH
jgi:hypothetical protein